MAKTLKQEIIAGMKAKQLRRVAQALKIELDDHRRRDSLVGGIRRSRRATAKVLLGFLSAKELKQLCADRGIEPTKRKAAMMERLLASSEAAPATGKRGPRSTRQDGGPGKSTMAREDRPSAPGLQFGPSTDRAGFTPAGIAAFSDLRPEAVVRELIQNSLDAALIEADESCARVRFRRSTCELQDIPGIESYRSAFQRAADEQRPAGSARAVVERIERALASDAHEVLLVMDNGVGLDGKRMAALLSDGISAKGGNAAGTFGNGHSVVVPASNLRYVLYGGLTAEGDRFGGGQAVLASHSVHGESVGRSGRGLYLTSFERSAEDVPFTLVRDDALPPIVSDELGTIRELYGHGAVVVIPAFNNFEHDESLWEAVSRAAAFHFFQAIHEGTLVVEVDDPDGGGVLEAGTLREVLERYREEPRARRTGGLSGRKAYEGYQTLSQGETHQISTSQGEVILRLRRQEGRRSVVGLCRNGMWITDDLPMFQNAFTDRQPFQALILLDPGRDDDFYGLIREAETPLHDKLALTQMEPRRRKALRDALREIRDGLVRLVPESESDSYTPEDILTFQFSELEGQGRGGRLPSFWGKVGSSRREMVTRRTDEKGERENGTGGGSDGSGGGGRKRMKQRGRIVVEPIFRIASVPASNGRRTVHIECTEDFEDAELRMFVDENVDATCDRQSRAQAAALLLSNAVLDGRPVDESALIRKADGTVGVKLGSLAAGVRLVFEADCTVTEDAMRLLRGQAPAIRVEILSSRGADAEGTVPEDREPSADG